MFGSLGSLFSAALPAVGALLGGPVGGIAGTLLGGLTGSSGSGALSSLFGGGSSPNTSSSRFSQASRSNLPFVLSGGGQSSAPIPLSQAARSLPSSLVLSPEQRYRDLLYRQATQKLEQQMRQEAMSPMERLLEGFKKDPLAGIALGAEALRALRPQEENIPEGMLTQAEIMRQIQEQQALQDRINTAGIAALNAAPLARQKQSLAINPLEYGFGGEQEMFDEVNPDLPKVSKFKKGGKVPAKGNAGGQDDVVPALLAPGEYVMDAETVAMLGDGNNDTGAKKLDSMRVRVRSQKRGADKNKIPPKAKKRAEDYL